jgi:hypothetical protein
MLLLTTNMHLLIHTRIIAVFLRAFHCFHSEDGPGYQVVFYFGITQEVLKKYFILLIPYFRSIFKLVLSYFRTIFQVFLSCFGIIL